MIEIDTRLRAASGFGKTETEGSISAFNKVKRRGNPDGPPAVASDGWGGHRDALVDVWGKVPPRKPEGRPPTLKRPGADWKYLQVNKQRDGFRLIGVTIDVVYGETADVVEILGANTAFIERTHLTMRHTCSRLNRKTLGFSKRRAMLQAACTWDDIVYNLAHPVKTLRVPAKPNDQGRRWQRRTPAMVAGLADHIWTIKEILSTVPLTQADNT